MFSVWNGKCRYFQFSDIVLGINCLFLLELSAIFLKPTTELVKNQPKAVVFDSVFPRS